MGALSRRLIALVVALVASWPLAAVAATAACPDTIPSAAFLDLGGLDAATVDSIDCLAHYGITAGVGPGSYQPTGSVPRWQMALFLVRTASALRIALPDGAGSAFSDLTGLGADTQRSIQQLAQLGITGGTAPGQFSPLVEVPRWQMALFLMRLLANAGIVLPDGAPQGFIDLGGLSAEAIRAVNQARQLGVATGTTPTTFNPAGLVKRSDMAVFLARILNAGGGRHVRLSLTLSTTTAPVHGAAVATVIATKPNGQPYPGLLIDLFSTQGLAADGTCLIDVDAALNGGDAATSLDCRIDAADPLTNSDGKVSVGLAHTATAETDTIWAWTGAAGQVFDSDLVAERVSATLLWTPTADGLVLPSQQNLVFGRPVSVAAQLTGAALSGQTMRFAVLRNGATILTSAVITNSAGTATLAYTGPPDPTAADDPPVLDTVMAFWDRNGNGIDDGAAEFEAETAVEWDEAP